MMKTWTGAFLAACLFAACPVSANTGTNDFSSLLNLSALPTNGQAEVVNGQGMVSVLREALLSPGAKGFLKKENTPPDIAYLPSEATEQGLYGEILFRQKDVFVPALVVHSEFTAGEDRYLLQDMFGSTPLSERSRQELYRFNLILLSSENIWNDMSVGAVRMLNELTKNKGVHIPYNLVAVDYLETEQLHRLRESPRIYTAGVRVVATVDGIAVPIYIKMYIFPYEKSYRVLFLAGPESGHAIIKAGGDRLALLYAR